jgi:hypothetical protein
LDDVFGFAVVTHDSAGNSIETLVVPLHDDAKGIAVRLAREQHELGVPERFQLAWHFLPASPSL